MQGYYDDIAQICLNGHIVNGAFQLRSQDNKEFCPACGEKTITKCPQCKDSIQGSRFKHRSHFEQGWGEEEDYIINPCRLPSYCYKCGKPFPWTEGKIQTAIQIFAEFGGLDGEEKKTIEDDIRNISRDVPQGELSAMRIRKIWGKYGKIAYNVIMEFASKTAAEILKHPE